MKIGLVIDYFKPHSIGGAERSTRELARALVEHGHEPTILTPNYGAPPEEDDDGVPIRRYWFPRKIAPGRQAPGLWIKNPLYYWVEARLIASIAGKLGLEILHAQNSYVQIPTYHAARRLRKASVATIRDINALCTVGHLTSSGRDPEHHCPGEFHRCRREFFAAYYPHATAWFRLRWTMDVFLKQFDLRWRQRVLQRYSTVLFVSQGIREEYRRHGFPVEACNTAVVHNIPPASRPEHKPNPIPAEWNIPPDAPVVAFVGKISLGKGVHILLQSIPQVLRRYPDAVFVLAGRWTPQVEIPRDLPSDNIRRVGRIPSELVQSLLSRADLSVLPSLCPDAFSSAVLEALECGTPVIGTLRGGTPEQIVDGENGWLVEAGDAEGLAAAIVEALSDRDRLHRMSVRCRTTLSELFNRDRIVDEMIAVYDSALAAGPTGLK